MAIPAVPIACVKQGPHVTATYDFLPTSNKQSQWGSRKSQGLQACQWANEGYGVLKGREGMQWHYARTGKEGNAVAQ